MNEEEIEQKYKDNVYYKQNPEMFMQLAIIVENTKDTYVRKIKTDKFNDLKKWIYDQLTFLNNDHFHKDDYSMKEMIYLILNGMENFPKCAICERLLDDPNKFISIVKGFLLCCSKDCSNIRRLNSFKMTSMKTYGTNHPLKSTRGYQHYCDTLEKHHGVRNTFQMEKSKKQIKITKKINHGYENYTNVEKSRQTRYQRFGGRWESVDSKKKRKASFKKHYGVDNNMKCKAGLQEYFAGFEKKYGKGIKNPSQVTEIKCKQRSKYKYDNCFFDSAPEIAFYIWLKDNAIEFEYKPKIFFIYIVDKVKHRYFPDFKIGDLIFELKGDQFFNENGIMQNPYDHSQDRCFAEKQKCMMRNDVIVLKSAEYQMFELYIMQKYGCNYIKQFKVNKKCHEECNKR